MKLNHHAALRAIGAHLYHASNKSAEYWTIPASAEDKFYDMRDSIPFDNLLSGFRDGGFIIYLDKPKATDALIAAAPDLLAALESILQCVKSGIPANLDAIEQARAAIARARGE